MKSEYLKIFVLTLMVIQICFTTHANADTGEETWIDPDAWARDHLNTLPTTTSKCCKCSEDMAVIQYDSNPEQLLKTQQQTKDDTASLIYFKKLLTMLFNRKHFKYDSTLEIYERSLVFTVQSSQLDKLEQLQDPRDLDNILTEIFVNVRNLNLYREGHKQLHTTEASSGFIAIVFKILYHIWKVTKTSEIQFILVVVLVILIAWTFNIRFNIGWFSLIFGGIFIYGFLHTYLECNRELEVTQMLKILNRDKGSKHIRPKSSIFFLKKYLKEIFYSDDEHELHQQKLKEAAKLSSVFCRPDHVLIMYFNDIFLKYLQVLVEQFTITLKSINDSVGFPFNMISGILLFCMIGYIIKLTFKYILSPSVWVLFMHRKQPYPPELHAVNTSRDNSNDDRLSGDNLKLLLNAITAEPIRKASKHPSAVGAVSGVEEVKEAVEETPKNISPQIKNSTDAENQHNINSTENSLYENTNPTVEDLSEVS